MALGSDEGALVFGDCPLVWRHLAGDQFGVGEVGLGQGGAAEVAEGKIGPDEADAVQQGAAEVGVTQPGVGQVRCQPSAGADF
jgi:hypothetical protein